ncbi:hypothetical protein [Micromonospora sp. WMMD812]|uniref:hypothetical protein n=1 Tax=Micromonospora sp. WMMD812 TaxID=3015152 RepID=UPI00248C1CEF|nr:hypothetical protein [Micromonospora sp. WMMD812]WBB70125.1 hypothetical protein O7603_12495 [Micromonospora sp. WMMD812]
MPSNFEIAASIAAPILAAVGPLAISRMQNRREARIRASIISNIELARSLQDAEPQSEEATWLRLHIRSQVAALIEHEQKEVQRRRDWGMLFFVAGFGLPALPVLYWMWPPEQWWLWAVFVLVAAYAAAVIIGGLGATFQPSNKRRREPEERPTQAASDAAPHDGLTPTTEVPNGRAANDLANHL